MALTVKRSPDYPGLLEETVSQNQSLQRKSYAMDFPAVICKCNHHKPSQHSINQLSNC